MQEATGKSCCGLEGMRGGVNCRYCVQVAIGCSYTPLESDTLCLLWTPLEVGVPAIFSAGWIFFWVYMT